VSAWRALWFGLAAPTLACGSDDEDSAAMFNRWCDQVLCDWTLEQGRIERAPTWHDKDYGARLLDAPVVISQATTIDHERCTRFRLVGDIEAEARLALELDVYDEGPLEFEETIPETHWQAQAFVVPPVDLLFTNFAVVPASLRLHKRGTGNVVLARLEVDSIACVATSLVAVADIPVGEFCPSAERCRSGRCEPAPQANAELSNVCVDCQNDLDCGLGQSCVTTMKSLGAGAYSYRECSALLPYKTQLGAPNASNRGSR
jgi:hypothetical protein